MIDFKIEQENGIKTINVSGSLTIEDAAELKKVLLDSMTDADNVVFYLDNVTEADLSCLQLLCSAHKTFRHGNKRFTLSAGSTEAFNEAVKAAGFLRHMGCESECDKDCLWSNCN